MNYILKVSLPDGNHLYETDEVYFDNPVCAHMGVRDLVVRRTQKVVEEHDELYGVPSIRVGYELVPQGRNPTVDAIEGEAEITLVDLPHWPAVLDALKAGGVRDGQYLVDEYREVMTANCNQLYTAEVFVVEQIIKCGRSSRRAAKLCLEGLEVLRERIVT
jgi:hypothetical protein